MEFDLSLRFFNSHNSPQLHPSFPNLNPSSCTYVRDQIRLQNFSESHLYPCQNVSISIQLLRREKVADRQSYFRLNWSGVYETDCRLCSNLTNIVCDVQCSQGSSSWWWSLAARAVSPRGGRAAAARARAARCAAARVPARSPSLGCRAASAAGSSTPSASLALSSEARTAAAPDGKDR